MAQNGIRVTGLNAVQRFLLNLAPATKREILQITEATGRNIEADAKRRVPVDTGKLRQSISFTPTKGGFGAEVSVNERYGFYVEFGTGGLVEVPEGFEEFAGQFRGKGKRTVNLPARPYLIPAYLVHRDKYYEAISNAISRLLR